MRAKMTARGRVATALTATFLGLPLVAAAAAPRAIAVKVDAGKQSLATIAHGSVGLDIWIANKRGLDEQAKKLYREAGINAFGYDGGPTVDMFDWRTNSLRPWPNPERAKENFATTHGRMGIFEEALKPAVSFDDFGQLNRELGATGRVHVNYGTGTPQEAADWVAYSKQRGYDVKYWEIGQFMSGNGVLGNGNEPDAHKDKSAKAYATNSLKFIEAMRAADPAIKIGVHMSSGRSEGGPGRAWDEEVLSILGPHIDFIDLWMYPNFGSSDAESLQSTSTIPAMVASYRKMLTKFGTAGRDYEIIVGESALDVIGAPRNMSLTAALFLPDQYLTLFASGVRRVDWFVNYLGPVPKFWYALEFLQPKLHNPKAMAHPAEAQVGEYGIISSGDCLADTNICQPEAHTPFAPYFGLKMLRVLARTGSELVPAASPDPLVTVHAAKRPDGLIATLLINKDPTSIKTVSLDVAGVETVQTGGAVLFYGKGSTDVSCKEADGLISGEVTLPPYSLTTFVVRTSSTIGKPTCQDLLGKR